MQTKSFDSELMTGLAPVDQRQRIRLLDSLRGMAVLGILIMNIMAMGQPHIYYFDMPLDRPITGPNFWAWVLELGFIEGTMRGIFSLLFGAGALLLLTRLENSRNSLAAADIYYRRTFLLIGLGLINAWILLWPGDVLYNYGLIGLAIFPLRKVPARWLLLPIFILIGISVYRDSAKNISSKETIAKGQIAEQLKARNQPLTETQTADLQDFQQYQEENNHAAIQKVAQRDLDWVQSHNFGKLLDYAHTGAARAETVSFFHALCDMGICFLIGMALFQCGFLTGKLSSGLYIAVAIAGIAIGLGINYYTMKIAYADRFDHIKITSDSPWLATYQIRRIIQTVGYLSLLIWLYKIAFFRRCFDILAPVGQMALTNYLSQSLITSILFFGFGVYGKIERYQLLQVAGCIWIFQIIFSHVWLRYFRFGPVEWAWRTLTYGKAQPVKREKVGV